MHALTWMQSQEGNCLRFHNEFRLKGWISTRITGRLEEEVTGIIRDGKAIVEVAAGQIPVNDLLYAGTEKSIFPFLSFHS
jgi:hypothetical protein